MLHEHEVRASLARSISHLPASAHDSIIRQLQADGLCDGGGEVRAAAAGARRFSTLRAAAQDRGYTHLAKQALAMLAHAGIKIDTDAPIDPVDLSTRLKNADVPLQRRWEIKSCLAQLGVI